MAIRATIITECFHYTFQALEYWEQNLLLSSVERIVIIMAPESYDIESVE
ncbi:MAG: hypothetical protein ACI9J4_001521 [Paraglaciecola sp.]|jgi:hypothetical protein